MKNNIEKPLSLIIKEFRNNLENAVNNSNLPPCIVEPILKDYYNQVLILSNNTSISEEQEYVQTINNNKEETSN